MPYSPTDRKTSASSEAATKKPARSRNASISFLTDVNSPIALARIKTPKTPRTGKPAWRAKLLPCFSSISRTSGWISVAKAIASASPLSRSLAKAAATAGFATTLRLSHPTWYAWPMRAFASGVGMRSNSARTASGIQTI